jgi:hypothetical protein
MERHNMKKILLASVMVVGLAGLSGYAYADGVAAAAASSGSGGSALAVNGGAAGISTGGGASASASRWGVHASTGGGTHIVVVTPDDGFAKASGGQHGSAFGFSAN